MGSKQMDCFCYAGPTTYIDDRPFTKFAGKAMIMGYLDEIKVFGFGTALFEDSS